MVTELVRSTREACLDALAAPGCGRVAVELGNAGIHHAQYLTLVRQIWETGHYPAALERQLAAVRETTEPPGGHRLERYLLLHAAVAALDRVPSLPVHDSVKRIICQEFRFFAAPGNDWLFHFEPGSYKFKAHCGTALLELFPAGQLSWQLSGLPRSWLLRVPLRSLPKLLYQTVFQLRGFRPCVVTHFSVLRTNFPLLLENACKRSYYRLAQSLKLQKDIKGLVTSSWLYAPETYNVTPHLSWMSRIILENGGFIGDIGECEPGAGFLEGSVLRKRLYESGHFKPREAMALWPRKAMLDWADRHPELADE